MAEFTVCLSCVSLKDCIGFFAVYITDEDSMVSFRKVSSCMTDTVLVVFNFKVLIFNLSVARKDIQPPQQ